MKFKLTIKMGNDAMLTYSDVRRALIVVTNKLREDREGEPAQRDAGVILDVNGNTVGEWAFKGRL